MSLKSVNPNAEVMNRDAALFMNINAAKGLQDVMKTNLGPKGTIKMLVDGAGGAFSCRRGRARVMNVVFVRCVRRRRAIGVLLSEERRFLARARS